MPIRLARVPTVRGTGPSERHSKRGRALLLFDLTRDRVEADGAWPLPGAEQIHRFIEGELAYFRERDRPVFHLVTRFDSDEELHDPSLPRFNLRGSPGAEFSAAFTPRPGEPVIEKPVDSALSGTDLAKRLAEMDVAQITLVGIETHSAVLATAIEAGSQGFHVIVPDTCVASRSDELNQAALRLLRDTTWLRRDEGPPGPGEVGR